MMGLPLGHVEEPLKHIYKHISENAFANPEIFLGKTYREYISMMSIILTTLTIQYICCI